MHFNPELLPKVLRLFILNLFVLLIPSRIGTDSQNRRVSVPLCLTISYTFLCWNWLPDPPPKRFCFLNMSSLNPSCFGTGSLTYNYARDEAKTGGLNPSCFGTGSLTVTKLTRTQVDEVS